MHAAFAKMKSKEAKRAEVAGIALDDTFYHQRGLALFNQSKFVEGLQDFNTAIEIGTKAQSQNLAVYFIDRARSYIELGKIDNAIKDVHEVRQMPKMSGLEGKYIEAIIRQIERKYAPQNAEGAVSEILVQNKKIIELENALKQMQAQLQSIQDEQKDAKDDIDTHQNLLSGMYEFVTRLEAIIPSQESIKQELLGIITNFQAVPADGITRAELDRLIEVFKADISKDLSNFVRLEEWNKSLQEVTVRLQTVESHISEIEYLLDASGIKNEVTLRKNLDKLKHDKPDLANYCVTFYQELHSFLQVYRLLSTEVFDGSRKLDEILKQDKYENIKGFAITVMKGGLEIFKTLYDSTGVVAAAQSVVGDIAAEKQRVEIKNQVMTINAVIDRCFADEIGNDNAIKLYQLAFKLSLLRQRDIQSDIDSNLNEEKKSHSGIFSKVETVLGKIKNKIISEEIEKYADSPIKKLALHDVLLIMSNFYQNSQTIIDGSTPMYELFNELILKAGFDVEKSQILMIKDRLNGSKQLKKNSLDKIAKYAQEGKFKDGIDKYNDDYLRYEKLNKPTSEELEIAKMLCIEAIMKGYNQCNNTEKHNKINCLQEFINQGDSSKILINLIISAQHPDSYWYGCKEEVNNVLPQISFGNAPNPLISDSSFLFSLSEHHSTKVVVKLFEYCESHKGDNEVMQKVLNHEEAELLKLAGLNEYSVDV